MKHYRTLSIDSWRQVVQEYLAGVEYSFEPGQHGVPKGGSRPTP